MNISKGIGGNSLLNEMIENPEKLRNELLNMVKHTQEVQKVLTGIDKTLERVSKVAKWYKRSPELV